MPARSLLITLTTVSALCCLSNAQTRLGDLAPPGSRTDGSSPRDYVEVGGRAVFAAITAFGQEVWSTDGTVGGSQLLRDIDAGFESGYVGGLFSTGNLAWFVGRSQRGPLTLWCTDGTPAGTHAVIEDVRYAPPRTSSDPQFGRIGNRLLFARETASTGVELWISDGTTTTLVADITPGTNSSGPTGFTAHRGLIYFTADDGTNGRELWRTDGTAAGTRMVADVAAGSASSLPATLTSTSGLLFFTGRDTASSVPSDLFVTDGTAANTRKVMSGLTITSSRTRGPQIGAVGSRVVFTADDGAGAGSEPWVSDGTAAGTMLLGDVWPGTSTSSAITYTTVRSNLALFVANDGTNGIELWQTDGTPGGTTLAVDVVPGPQSSTPSSLYLGPNGNVFFSAFAVGAGIELFVTDGTQAGTRLVADLEPGTRSSTPRDFGTLGNRVLFSAVLPNVGIEPLVTDGTAQGTTLLDDLAGDSGNSSPRDFHLVGDRTVFVADDASGAELWSSDGTPGGTVKLDFGPGSADPKELVMWNGELWGVANMVGVGAEIFRTDGTVNGTRLVLDMQPGTQSSNPRGLTVANGRLFFAATVARSTSAWVTDGTQGGTIQLGGSVTGVNSGDFVSFGSSVLFGAVDSAARTGVELWITDGTPAGTRQLVDIQPGSISSSPHDFIVSGNLCYFVADQLTTGVEIWVTDGTATGTRLVSNIGLGSLDANPTQLGALPGNRLIYEAANGSRSVGRELYVTDGTTTRMLPEIDPGSGNADVADLRVAGSRAWFTAHTFNTGRELYVSDGNTITLVDDWAPGTLDGIRPGTLATWPGTEEVVFGAVTPENGYQLLTTSGPSHEIRQILDLDPRNGVGVVGIRGIAVAGDRVWFGAEDGQTGLEPWAAPLRDVAFSSNYGRGCPGTNGVPRIGAPTAPQIGNAAFTFDLENARGNAACALNVGFAPAALQLGGCVILTANPIISSPTLTTDGQGRVQLPLGIPNAPALRGRSLYSQWIVLDPGGSLFGSAALSDGLRTRLGD